MMIKTTRAKMVCAILAGGILAACGASNELDPDQTTPDPVVLALDWDAKSDGVYPEAEARKDFRNISNWNSRVSIQNQAVVVKLLAGELSGAGGIVTRTSIPRATEYRLTFDVMFPEDFVLY